MARPARVLFRPLPLDSPAMKLAFVGGTGPEGLGLAIRFAASGHHVAIGSRSTERGEEGAAKVAEAVPGATVSGGANADVVAGSDVVFLTFPYSGQAPTLEALAASLDGLIVCDVVAPSSSSAARAPSRSMSTAEAPPRRRPPPSPTPVLSPHSRT